MCAQPSRPRPLSWRLPAARSAPRAIPGLLSARSEPLRGFRLSGPTSSCLKLSKGNSLRQGAASTLSTRHGRRTPSSVACDSVLQTSDSAHGRYLYVAPVFAIAQTLHRSCSPTHVAGDERGAVLTPLRSSPRPPDAPKWRRPRRHFPAAECGHGTALFVRGGDYTETNTSSDARYSSPGRSPTIHQQRRSSVLSIVLLEASLSPAGFGAKYGDARSCISSLARRAERHMQAQPLVAGWQRCPRRLALQYTKLGIRVAG